MLGSADPEHIDSSDYQLPKKLTTIMNATAGQPHMLNFM